MHLQKFVKVKVVIRSTLSIYFITKVTIATVILLPAYIFFF